MGRKRIPNSEKLVAVNLYLSGQISQGQLAELYGVTKTSVRQWIRNFDALGDGAFQKKNKKYSRELKLQAVQDYLEGKDSQDEICKKYGIRSRGKLQQWIKMYNSGMNFKYKSSGGSAIMTKGRKTTFEERVEIVEYCIAHDRNYAETAEKYGVSYQQARNYTIKYEESGVKGLKDNRGRRKPENEMSELERLRAEVKLLRAAKERAEMEVSFLKKLEEIERRRG